MKNCNVIVSSSTKELVNLGAICVVSDSKKCKVCALVPEISLNADGDADKVATLANVLKVAFQLVSDDKKLVDYFTAFNKFGIYCPRSAREDYISCIRKNAGNGLLICTNISDKHFDEDGKEVYDYTFAPLYVSQVPVKETALGMSKKTIEALRNIQHAKGWRNAARGLMAQFDVMTIKSLIKSGKNLVPELETEKEETPISVEGAPLETAKSEAV